jgi:hypothetical protein
MNSTETGIANSSVVDQYRDRAEAGFGGLDEGGDVGAAGDVGRLSENICGKRAKFSGGGLQRFRIPSAEADRGTELREFANDGLADATAATGDERNVATKRRNGIQMNVMHDENSSSPRE